MARIPKLNADVTANTSNFEAGLKRADAALEKSRNNWNSSLNRVNRGFQTFGRSVTSALGAIGLGLSVYKITSDLKSVVNEMDEISKAAQRLGASTFELSKLSYAAKLADVEFQALELSIRKMQDNLIQAENGSKPLVAAFDAIGLKVADLQKLSPTEQFVKVASAVAGIENPAKRTAIAMDIFGKAGAGVINIAGEGEVALRGMLQQAEKLGVAFDEKAGKAAEEFNDALTRLGQQYRGFLVQLASTENLDNAAEAIGRIGEGVINLLTNLNELALRWDEFWNGFNENTSKGLERAIDKNIDTLNDKLESRGKRGKWLDDFLGLDLAGIKDTQKELERLSALRNKIKEKERIDRIKDADRRIMAEGATFLPSAIDSPTANKVLKEEKSLKEDLAKQNDKLTDQEKERQKAFEQLGYSFESAFEDAILSGKKLSDVLEGLAQDIAKIVIRQTITQPIGNAVSGLLNSGGAGGFLSGIFDSLPSFDVGTNYVTHDQVAKIHKGEMIIPADEASALRNGGGNQGSTIVINATAQADVDRRILAAIPRIEEAVMGKVMTSFKAGGDFTRIIGKRK